MAISIFGPDSGSCNHLLGLRFYDGLSARENIFSALKVQRSDRRPTETRRPVIHLHINHQRYRFAISIARRSGGSHDCRLSLSQQTDRLEKKGARCPINEWSSVILSPSSGVFMGGLCHLSPPMIRCIKTSTFLTQITINVGTVTGGFRKGENPHI